MAGFKDKDLMKDTGGKTKVQKNYGGKHLRPPRKQQRNEQRQRFLTKEDKTDMNKQSFDSQEEKKDVNSQELDLEIGENGQVFVNDDPTEKQVMTFSDLVNIPSQVQNIRNYDDFNTSINRSMNDDSRYDVQINENTKQNEIGMESFDFKDDDTPQLNADVSNDDVILSDEQEQNEDSNPFDDLFNDDQTESETQNDGSEQPQDEETDGSEQPQSEDAEQSNDTIDQYLNMEIDDSKLSEQNKQKLDSFTSEQMDAFKKFLYQKKNQE